MTVALGALLVLAPLLTAAARVPSLKPARALIELKPFRPAEHPGSQVPFECTTLGDLNVSSTLVLLVCKPPSKAAYSPSRAVSSEDGGL